MEITPLHLILAAVFVVAVIYGRRTAPVTVPAVGAVPTSSVHRILKWGLGLWTVAFPVVSLSPMLMGGTSAGAAVGGVASVVVMATLFVPWVIGIIVLGILVLLTR